MTTCNNSVWKTSSVVVFRDGRFGHPGTWCIPGILKSRSADNTGEPCHLPFIHGSVSPTIALGTSEISSTFVGILLRRSSPPVPMSCSTIRRIPSTSRHILSPKQSSNALLSRSQKTGTGAILCWCGYGCCCSFRKLHQRLAQRGDRLDGITTATSRSVAGLAQTS